MWKDWKNCIKSLTSERKKKESLVLSGRWWGKWLAQAVQCRMALVQNFSEVLSWPKRKFVVLLVTNSTANLRHSKIMNQAPEITRLRRKGEFLETVHIWRYLDICILFFQSLLYITTYFQNFLPRPWGITDTLKNWDFHQIKWFKDLGLCVNHWLSETLIIHSKVLATKSRRMGKWSRKASERLNCLSEWLA